MNGSAAAPTPSHGGSFPPQLGRRQQQHHHHQQQPPHVMLYVVRHGESTGNREGVLQGQMEYPLTEIGRAQAAVTGRRLRAEAEEALAVTSSSGVSSSRDSAQAAAPPPAPISFFHRIFSSDLSRARETAELIVQELRLLEGSGSSGGSGEPGAATEGVICFDRDLREILGGAREGRPLGTSAKAAARQAAREQGVALEAFVPPPHETSKDLRRRARRFVEKVLTEVHASLFDADNADISQPQLQEEGHRSSGSGGRRGFPAALMLASPFRSSKPPRDGAEGEDDWQGTREQPPLPMRILVVSHGGLLLQMFQKVFNLHAVTRVLNASLTVVEARLPTSHPHHASAITNHRRRLALIFASPTSNRRTQPQVRGEGEGGEEEEEEEDEAAAAQLAAATAFRPVKINDVAHLKALHIVTTKSTAL